MEPRVPAAIPVALVGCGGWGRNILRVLSETSHAHVVAVADADPRRQAVARSLTPKATIVDSLERALLAGPTAVFIATPPHTQGRLVQRALAAGMDVFVEKPLATNPADAERCATLARSLGRVGMVGHLLRYHPAVVTLLALVASGAIGKPRAFESTRFSVAGDMSASPFWTLGPHDVSVLQAVDPSPVVTLSARSSAGGDPVWVEATLASGLAVNLALARVGPQKERRIRIVGTEGSAEYDDGRAHDCVFVEDAKGAREVRVAMREPLALEIEHFLGCVAERSEPLTSFEEGLRVVRLLARAEHSMTLPRRALARATSG